MYFQIKEIILWPKNKAFEPRRLSFELGKVNVITGTSKTGKSAIIPIIDYCLGADKCRIPVKTIRNSCEWFGVVVQTSSGQKLFARREPGSQQATGDMFISDAMNVVIPRQIESKNANVEGVKKSLDELAGLTALDFDEGDTGSGFKKRPSFRDLGAFIYQPQNIVANPDVLFFKTETYEHREKLRTIFPYVLNAITSEQLAKRHELADLKKELRRKENELTNVRQVSERWISEIKASVSEAKELGFIEQTIKPEASRDELVDLLTQVVHSATDKVRVTKETVSEAVEELVALQTEESAASMGLSLLRKRLTEMSALKESTIHYKDALQTQRDRLKVSEWVRSAHDRDHNCPLCGNQLTKATSNLEAIEKALKGIEEEAGQFGTIPAAFDREFERVRGEISLLTEKLRGIQIRRDALERRSDEAKSRQYDSLKASRFVGNLEQSLQTYSQVGTDGELEEEVHELSDRVSVLEKQISEAEIDAKTKRALNAVNFNAGKFLPGMDVERPNDPLSLSIDDLTIRIVGVDREDYLWEIGSGSNWLSYHIALTLGLQQYFLNLSRSPVPSFVAYDQPSQVYFPKKLAMREDEPTIDPEWKDEDIDAVRKVFNVFSSAVQANKGNLQIIVLDHASENVWGGIDNVHCVEEWRNGIKLVPINWLQP
ncbi:DUF3732 domain-containing protein [Dehalococcoides mccartyi]|uniref:DUF3732 domain-containing protein n=1 Tax=Dehalococcoides mccartyi TaxID=61435 RepID=A0AB38Z825_9CHLR|nr:DUF3732 domain-containing protein [Dehalococcoides mccartyi]WRO06711.1 DUF3732 domain-containing protein [Dehalococcoides mccartyi]